MTPGFAKLQSCCVGSSNFQSPFDSIVVQVSGGGVSYFCKQRRLCKLSVCGACDTHQNKLIHLLCQCNLLVFQVFGKQGEPAAVSTRQHWPTAAAVSASCYKSAGEILQQSSMHSAFSMSTCGQGTKLQKPVAAPYCTPVMTAVYAWRMLEWCTGISRSKHGEVSNILPFYASWIHCHKVSLSAV